MKYFLFSRVTLLGVVATLASGSVLAGQTLDFGKRLYDSNCASCHGLTGKGDGPMKASLTVAPSDLTTIAKKNKGVLPVARLNAVIDGRMTVGSRGAPPGGWDVAEPPARQVDPHGSREMPVWGQDFSAKVGTDWPAHMDVPYNPEVFVRGRIMALVDYIARLQEK